MPLYEYQCEGCGKRFEIIQRFSDQPLTTHEACGGTVYRLLSAPALQFKGSGWYVNDYAKSSKPESKPEGDGGSKKTESTPATNSSSESSKTASTPTSSPDKKTGSSHTKGSSDTKN
jgi:putative FmdB family regulatory protein